MDGIPPALPTDSEDVVWALQTADSLWKRGERADAIVWLRRAAQAAGDADDAKRAASLARKAAELSDALKRGGKPAAKKKPLPGMRTQSLEDLDRMLGGGAIAKPPPPKPKPAPPKSPESSGSIDVEVVSASDFEAGFGAAEPAKPVRSEKPGVPSEHAVMTISSHAPDVELIEDEAQEAPADEVEDVDADFPEEEPTPVRLPRQSPPPRALEKEPSVPSAAQAHAGMLDPWAESDRASRAGKAPGSRRGFDEEEVITSAKRPAKPPPTSEESMANVPSAPKAPRVPEPRKRPAVPAPAPPSDDEPETTTYRQINPRSKGPARPDKPAPRKSDPDSSIPLSSTSFEVIDEKTSVKPPKPPKPPPPKPPPPAPKAPSDRPAMDLLELVDSVVAPELEPEPEREPEPPTSPPPPALEAKATPLPSSEPEPEPLGEEEPTPIAPEVITIAPATSVAPIAHPSAVPTPRPPNASQIPVSARPTAPPPSSSVPDQAVPSAIPTRPRAGSTLLDLEAVEALADLPDDARDAFAQAATMHKIAVEEEVSHFALALVVDGTIDVSSAIADAPALKLEKNAILRSRGSLLPGVAMRLVCSSEKALVATWDDAAVAAAFRTCPWVEDDLRAVADRVQAKVGLTMGPLGERWDLSLREFLVGKLTLKSLAPGEVLVAQGKPVPFAIVGVGEVVAMKGAERTTLRAGDFVFPHQVLAHASAPATAAAGGGGAIVLYGDRAVAQELLMSFPPILEVLATI